MVHIILAMQSMIILSITFTFLAQICGSNYFERLKQTLNEISFCTTDYGKYKDKVIGNRHMDNDSMKQQLGKKLNRTIIILFWNKPGNDGIMDGLGFQPFQTCLHKNCLSTRDKSLLNNPKYIIDAIVFYGDKNKKVITELKKFKESDELVKQMNQGIKPKLVLFMPVSLV